MNKLLSVHAIALLCATGVRSQVEQDLSNVLRTKDFAALQAFADTMPEHNSRISGGWNILRDLAGGYREGVLLFERSVPDRGNPGVSTVYRFRADVLANETTVVYYRLSAIRNKKVGDSWEPYLDSIDSYRNDKALDSLHAAFKAVYRADLDERELFTTDLVYGEHCGYIGVEPEGREQIDGMVARKDKAGLVTWLQSPNAEKQVYAIDGLHQLKELGMELTEEERQMIEAVKHKNGSVFVCSGCIHSYRDIGSVTHKFRF